MHIVMLCIAQPFWSHDPVTWSERQKLVVACHTLTLEKQHSPPPTRVCRLQCSTCEATRWPRPDCSILPKWLRIITTYPDTNMPYITMHPNSPVLQLRWLWVFLSQSPTRPACSPQKMLLSSMVCLCDVWCMMCDVWCIMYDVWCVLYDIWCMMYDVWYMMYDVWCTMYDV